MNSATAITPEQPSDTLTTIIHTRPSDPLKEKKSPSPVNKKKINPQKVSDALPPEQTAAPLPEENILPDIG